MNSIERDIGRQAPHSAPLSVLSGREYIRGLPTDKRSSVEEARTHPEQLKVCKSVLDGPACIIGLPH